MAVMLVPITAKAMPMWAGEKSELLQVNGRWRYTVN